MSSRFVRTVTLLALTAFSALALADPPARVGRIALAEGQVSVGFDAGIDAGAALLNWPLTSGNQLSTGPGSRAEFRVGSTAVRLDADSALEISELDDDSLRLRLHYGSASVRIRNAEVVRGFELGTPQGRVRMQQPGRIRVDAERSRESTVVNVFEGVALVEGGGSQLTVRMGKRAEIEQDDVRTALAVRDSFDDWALLRDRRDERSSSARYVSSEMTGYEELDRNGTWRDDSEYGPLWLPRAVPAGWAPYRDGRWTWLAPWGWTWIDNAPWAYAPSHYGRWVHVRHRWAWAPGRHAARPVWAPALVGWVGGSGWSLTFGSNGTRRPLPAQGWYPLTPYDPFVPGYLLSQQRLHDHNRHVRRDARRDRRDRQREGLTVVPHDHFGRRDTILVPKAPKAILPPLALQNAPAAPPPVPQGVLRDRREHRDDRDDRFERGGRFERDSAVSSRGHRTQPGVVQSAPPAPQPALQPAPRPPVVMSVQPVVTNQQPVAAPRPFPQRETAPSFERVHRQRPMPAAIAPAPVAVAPAPAAVFVPPPAARPAPQQAPAFQPPPAQVRAAPPPAPVAAPAPAPVRRNTVVEERKRRIDTDSL